MSSFSSERPAGLERWLHELERRHLANLRFVEVTRALRAVSAGYVERRDRLAARSPFEGAGKRAAYAMFYGPLHFLTVDAIVRRLPRATDPIRHLADWGCGTGAAGAAWASTAAGPPPHISAFDAHPWAIAEARETYAALGLDATVRRGDVINSSLQPDVDALVLGWVVNELDDDARRTLLARLLEWAARAVRILIVEPIATSVTPWWNDWKRAFEAMGGRGDEWRFAIELPPLVRKLDVAAGMRHDELTARSLWIGL